MKKLPPRLPPKRAQIATFSRHHPETRVTHAQLCFEREQQITLTYKGTPINSRLRVDLIVAGLVIVELKAVECVHPIHSSQVITYLKLADCPAGLLLNFNVTVMKNGVKRLDHPDLYSPKKQTGE